MLTLWKPWDNRHTDKFFKWNNVCRTKWVPARIQSPLFAFDFVVIAPNYYVKSVHIRSFSGLYFPAFGLRTERYSVSLCIHPNMRKYGLEKFQIWTHHPVNVAKAAFCYFILAKRKENLAQKKWMQTLYWKCCSDYVKMQSHAITKITFTHVNVNYLIQKKSPGGVL